jgi:hypothetical protein
MRESVRLDPLINPHRLTKFTPKPEKMTPIMTTPKRVRFLDTTVADSGCGTTRSWDATMQYSTKPLDQLIAPPCQPQRQLSWGVQDVDCTTRSPSTTTPIDTLNHQDHKSISTKPENHHLDKVHR